MNEKEIECQTLNKIKKENSKWVSALLSINNICNPLVHLSAAAFIMIIIECRIYHALIGQLINDRSDLIHILIAQLLEDRLNITSSLRIRPLRMRNQLIFFLLQTLRSSASHSSAH